MLIKDLLAYVCICDSEDFWSPNYHQTIQKFSSIYYENKLMLPIQPSVQHYWVLLIYLIVLSLWQNTAHIHIGSFVGCIRLYKLWSTPELSGLNIKMSYIKLMMEMKELPRYFKMCMVEHRSIHLEIKDELEIRVD